MQDFTPGMKPSAFLCSEATKPILSGFPGKEEVPKREEGSGRSENIFHLRYLSVWGLMSRKA